MFDDFLTRKMKQHHVSFNDSCVSGRYLLIAVSHSSVASVTASVPGAIQSVPGANLSWFRGTLMMSGPTFAAGQIEMDGRQLWDRETNSYNSYS